MEEYEVATLVLSTTLLLKNYNSATTSNKGDNGGSTNASMAGSGAGSTTSGAGGTPRVRKLACRTAVSLACTARFSICCCGSKCGLVSIRRSGRCLVIPRNRRRPRGLTSSVIIVRRPARGVCVTTATSVSLFSTVNKVSGIGFSKLRTSN